MNKSIAPEIYFSGAQTVKKLIHCEREGMFSTLAFGQSRLRRPDIFPVLFSTLAFGQSRLRRPDIFPVLGNEGTPEFIPQAEFISAEENPVFLRPDKVQGFSQK